MPVCQLHKKGAAAATPDVLCDFLESFEIGNDLGDEVVD